LCCCCHELCQPHFPACAHINFIHSATPLFHSPKWTHMYYTMQVYYYSHLFLEILQSTNGSIFIQCTDQRMCYKTTKLKTPLILSIQLIKQNTNFYNHCFTSCAVFKCLQLHRTFDIKVHQGKWLQTAQSANCSVASVLATPLFLSVEQPALIKQLCY
jgi:hypothetical protein